MTDATILVVDDQPVQIRMLGEVLRRHYRVILATSGEEGLRMAREQSPDLVLLDIVMPGMDGFAVFRKMQEDERTRGIPVVFVTVRDTDVDHLRGLEAGVVDYITKPYSAQVVLARVRIQLELKFARDRLAASEASYRALFLHSPLAITAWRMEDGVVRLAEVNQAAEQVFPGVEKSRGRTAAEVFPGIPDLGERLLTCCRVGLAERRELTLAGGEDGPRHVVAHFTRIPPDVSLMACEDVTGEHKAQELRQEVEAIIRHDLKGPITATISAIRMLARDKAFPESLRHLLKLMEDANYGLLDMVNNLLSLRRVEQGSYQAEFTRVDLADILRTVLRELSPSLDRAGVRARLLGEEGELPEDFALVLSGDGSLLHSVFSNLVQNALEASARGDAVTVTLRRAEGGAEAKVHNPALVPEAVRDRFFTKYATSGKPKGTGLGAYAARLFTELHGGAIGMRSFPAEGTTVRVFLPDRSTDQA